MWTRSKSGGEGTRLEVWVQLESSSPMLVLQSNLCGEMLRAKLDPEDKEWYCLSRDDELVGGMKGLKLFSILDSYFNSSDKGNV